MLLGFLAAAPGGDAPMPLWAMMVLCATVSGFIGWCCAVIWMRNMHRPNQEGLSTLSNWATKKLYDDQRLEKALLRFMKANGIKPPIVRARRTTGINIVYDDDTEGAGPITYTLQEDGTVRGERLPRKDPADLEDHLMLAPVVRRTWVIGGSSLRGLSRAIHPEDSVPTPSP